MLAHLVQKSKTPSRLVRGSVLLAAVTVMALLLGGCLPQTEAPPTPTQGTPGTATLPPSPSSRYAGEDITNTPAPVETTAAPEALPTAIPNIADGGTAAAPALTPTPDLPTATMSPSSVPTATRNPNALSGPLPLARPILPPGNVLVDPTYRFGSTQDGLRDPHHGVELLNDFGTAVHAAGPGQVVFAGDDNAGGWGPYYAFYGNFVAIEHPVEGQAEPVYSLYAHLSEVLVQQGDLVQTGDLIGKVGFTGAAEGSHLHFEVRRTLGYYTSSMNPELWLAPLTLNDGQLTGALAGRILTNNGLLIQPIPSIVIEPEGGGSPVYTGTYEDFNLSNQPPFYETFGVGELAPGKYTVSFVSYGLNSFTVEILPGQVTSVELVVPGSP